MEEGGEGRGSGRSDCTFALGAGGGGGDDDDDDDDRLR